MSGYGNYPDYPGNDNWSSGNLGAAYNGNAVWQKMLMARAKKNKDWRGYKRLAAVYRQNMGDTVRLNPIVNADGWIGYGKYRRTAGRYMRGTQRRRRYQYRRYGLRGRGFYRGFLADAGGFLGGAATKATGIPGLGGIGKRVGQWISGKTGFGAYQDSGSTISGSVPIMMNVTDKEGVISITKREYLGDVISPTNGFHKLFEININPGDNELCPWASDIARKFEKWKLISMTFTYTSHSGDTSTSTQIGRIMGCHLSDPLREAPSTVAEISQINLADVGSPNDNKTFGVECDRRLVNDQWKWIRRVPYEYTDLNRAEETDHGRFFLYCDGIPGTQTNVGALHVSYEIALLNPLHTGTADNYKTSATVAVDSGAHAGSNYLLGANAVYASNDSGPLRVDTPLTLTNASGWFITNLNFRNEVVGKFRIDIQLKHLNNQNGYALMCAPLAVTSTTMRMFRGFGFYGNGINDWGTSGPLEKYMAISGQEIPIGSMKCFNNNPFGTVANTEFFDDNTTFTYFVEKFATGVGTFQLDAVRYNGNHAEMPATPTDLQARSIEQTSNNGLNRRQITVTRLPNDFKITLA